MTIALDSKRVLWIERSAAVLQETLRHLDEAGPAVQTDWRSGL